MDLGFAICRGKALQPAKPDWAHHCGSALLADLPRDQSNGSVERSLYSEVEAKEQQLDHACLPHRWPERLAYGMPLMSTFG